MEVSMKKDKQLHNDSKISSPLQPARQAKFPRKDRGHKKTGYKYHINHKHKDSLFRLVFNNKEDLLDLYNAVNNTRYTNVSDLSVYTLDDAVYISYKNDISFLFGEVLNLYEHQSTLNPNMPVRGLIYLAKNIEAYIELAQLDIYSSVLQKLPFPQYIVFYNGTENASEKMTLKLSDAFPVVEGKVPCLECTATLLNINYGQNKTLMERCRKLQEYACFIHSIRENKQTGMSLDQAVDKAIDDCIREHILESVLIKQRAEVRHVVLSTFNQENHDRILKETHEKIGEERGIAIGEERGIAIGEKNGRNMLLKNQVARKIARKKTIEEICDELEQDRDTIFKIIDELSRTTP